MKSAIIKPIERANHHCTWGGAFAQGLKRNGWKASVQSQVGPCDLLVLWGVRLQSDIRRQLDRGGEVCILERGYVGDRFAWTSVSFGGGLNGRGIFRGPFADGSRWEANFAHLMKPWRQKSDGYALIMQQVPGDNSIIGVDMTSFYANARAAFKSRGPVKMRPHPRATPKHGADKMAEAQQSLQDDLAGASVAITWNSNSGVDAVLAGVPTIAMDKGSMAWDVTGHELKMPPTPDRMAWVHALAWKQWTQAEMASGECAEAIGL